MEELDRRILAFAGAHPFVLEEQIERLVSVEQSLVAERLSSLEVGRLVRMERLRMEQTAFVRVTASGLSVIGSRLPAPSLDVVDYRREVGVVWLWVVAWQGVFGEAERVLSAREMQALDRATGEVGDGDGRFAVPVAAGAAANRQLYPDVMLVFGSERVAVHLVTWPHRRLDLDALFAGHRMRPDVADIVLVFVDDTSVGRGVRAAAERQSVSEKVRVQRVAGEGTALSRGTPSAG